MFEGVSFVLIDNLLTMNHPSYAIRPYACLLVP